MCLSGDIYDLNNEQWKIVDDSIRFYKKYSHIIADGESSFFGTKVESYIEPKGWQAVVRYCEKQERRWLLYILFRETSPTRSHYRYKDR